MTILQAKYIEKVAPKASSEVVFNSFFAEEIEEHHLLVKVLSNA